MKTNTPKTTRSSEKIGDMIRVNRGSLGSWEGKIVEFYPYGWAMGVDAYGVIEMSNGTFHSFDTCVHKLEKIT